MSTKSPLKILGLTIMASSALMGLSGCEAPAMRESTAQHLASPAWMVKRHIEASPFVLTAFERAHERGAPATIYIEGDGLNWITRTQRSLDPTPTNPVALHLASMDKAENVIYLARPCQYSKLTDKTKPCNADYWTGKRYAPEIVEAMNKAIDNAKATYDITDIHLVGFSGGGNIAALLAERREDVKSLRTVAGNLNHKLHSEHHQVSYLDPSSLNAIDIAPKLKNLPQRHFIGGQDSIVPGAIQHSFIKAVGSENCIHHTFIQEAEHDKGWPEKWPELLKLPVTCAVPVPEKGKANALAQPSDFRPHNIKRIKRDWPVKP